MKRSKVSQKYCKFGVFLDQRTLVNVSSPRTGIEEQSDLFSCNDTSVSLLDCESFSVDASSKRKSEINAVIVSKRHKINKFKIQTIPKFLNASGSVDESFNNIGDIDHDQRKKSIFHQDSTCPSIKDSPCNIIIRYNDRNYDSFLFVDSVQRNRLGWLKGKDRTVQQSSAQLQLETLVQSARSLAFVQPYDQILQTSKRLAAFTAVLDSLLHLSCYNDGCLVPRKKLVIDNPNDVLRFALMVVYAIVQLETKIHLNRWKLRSVENSVSSENEGGDYQNCCRSEPKVHESPTDRFDLLTSDNEVVLETSNGEVTELLIESFDRDHDFPIKTSDLSTEIATLLQTQTLNLASAHDSTGDFQSTEDGLLKNFFDEQRSVVKTDNNKHGLLLGKITEESLHQEASDANRKRKEERQRYKQEKMQRRNERREKRKQRKSCEKEFPKADITKKTAMTEPQMEIDDNRVSCDPTTTNMDTNLETKSLPNYRCRIELPRSSRVEVSVIEQARNKLQSANYTRKNFLSHAKPQSSHYDPKSATPTPNSSTLHLGPHTETISPMIHSKENEWGNSKAKLQTFKVDNNYIRNKITKSNSKFALKKCDEMKMPSNSIPSIARGSQFSLRREYDIETAHNKRAHHQEHRQTSQSCASTPYFDKSHRTLQDKLAEKESNRKFNQGAQSDVTKSAEPHVVSPPVLQKYDTSIPISLLCSEAFLESWASVVADLSTGSWYRNTQIEEAMQNCKINLIDSILVDASGVDIELPGRCGILVFSISVFATASDAKQIIVDVANLVAIGRYSIIYITLCNDVEITADISKHIVQLQCAVTTPGGRQSQTFISYASFSTVASSIGHTITNQLVKERIIDAPRLNLIIAYAEDEVYLKRAQFLLSLLPTLCASGAIECLIIAQEILPKGPAFKMIFQNERLRHKILTVASSPENVCEVHPDAMIQLSRALDAPL